MFRLVLAAVVPALVVFAVVQDRVTASGAHEYVMQSRASLAGGPDVTLEQVMAPAIRRSVQLGTFWGALAGAGGLAGAVVVGRAVQRRRHRE